MKKIPTLFVRDPEDRRYVTPEITPGCEWVLAGEGTATRKWDGTCCMYDGTDWWARREVKPGKAAPAGYVLLETDRITGKSVGWEPAAQSSFAKYIAEATAGGTFEPRTYELVGPKVNGNPERLGGHLMMAHGAWNMSLVPVDYARLGEYLNNWPVMEGIVWHHPDGRMAKIKRKDFPSVGGETNG